MYSCGLHMLNVSYLQSKTSVFHKNVSIGVLNNLNILY